MRPLTTLLLTVAVVAGAPAGAAAQDDPPSPTPRPPAADPRAYGLALKPVVVETLGLSFNPPESMDLQINRVEGRVTVSMFGTDPTWQMSIGSRISTLPDPSPSSQMSTMLESNRAAGHEPQIISNEAVDYGGAAGQRCYFRKTTAPGVEVVQGFLMISRKDQEFLVFALETTPEHFPRVQQLAEACFATIRLRDVEEIAQRREQMLDAGRAFLDGLSVERLRALVGRRQSFRYYLPAGTGGIEADMEIGWYMVEVREAKRGAVNPKRLEENYDSIEHEVGLLVYVYGRYLDQVSQITMSSEAHYWVAWDRTEETWSIVSTQRQGRKEKSEAVSGTLTREASGPGMLHVISSSVPREERRWRVPEVYLPQAIRWLLPYLLVGERPGERSYYCVDTVNGLSLSLRVDDLAAAREGKAAWVLRSQPKPDMPVEMALLDAEGRLVRKSWPNGSIAVPMSLADLQKLWRSKGLDTGRMPR